jgi:hypothetical protein
MNPIEGTEILFLEDGKWWNKNSEGVIVPTNTVEYLKRYKLRNSLVVVTGEDDKYVSSLNGSDITVVVDKVKIGRPNMESYEFTKEWLSLTDFLKLRKATADFCLMAKNFHIPTK